MRRTFVVAIFAGILAMLTISSAVAQTHPQDSDMCPHDPTIGSLQTCIDHMEDMGVIDSFGVANSMQAKIGAAQAAQDRGELDVAVQNLNALVHQVEAQAGKHIAEPHATHLVQHAQMVISVLAQ